MYVIAFAIFILKFRISVSEAPFPLHIDLQKVGVTIFNNEKFNILKPITHLVTDHFKDFMLRRESSKHSAERVFIDHNGFRHQWSGIGEKTKSLRKTDLKQISGFVVNTSPEHEISKEGNEIDMTDAVEDTNVSSNNVSSNEKENNNQEEENIVSENDTDQNSTEEETDTLESEEITTIINSLPEAQKNNSSNEITFKKRLRTGEKGTKPKPAPAKNSNATKKPNPNKANNSTKKPADKIDTPAKKEDSKDDKKTDSADKAQTKVKAKKGAEDSDEKKQNVKKETKERTVAKTTFFCPFFGVITMSAFVD